MQHEARGDGAWNPRQLPKKSITKKLSFEIDGDGERP